MPKNNPVLGIAALLLVVAAQNNDGTQVYGNSQSAFAGHHTRGNHQSYDGNQSHGNQPIPYRRLPNIDIPKMARGLHRMAGIANGFDNLGQMALNAPSALQMFSAMGGGLGGLLGGGGSSGDEGLGGSQGLTSGNFGGSYDPNGSSTIPEIIGNNLPDLGKLAQSIGPIISSFGNISQNNRENENALF